MRRAERVWLWLGGKTFLTAILTTLLLVLMLTLLIPQSPVPPSDSTTFYRWLSEVRSGFDAQAELLRALGLFSLRVSLWMQVPLALLSLAGVARGTLLAETWPRIAARLRGARLAAVCGSLLVLSGWGAQTLWGWQTVEALGRPGQTVEVPGKGLSLLLPERLPRLWNGRYGLYLLPYGQGLELEVTATDGNGGVLEILSTARSAPQTALHIALTPNSPDAYYALPAIGMIFRATLQPTEITPTVQMQIYRLVSGELVAETALEGNGAIFTEDVKLQVETQSLLRPRIIYNPGALPLGLGLLLLSVGLILDSEEASAAESAV